MRDNRLNRMTVDGKIRVYKTVPLPPDRLIPREHWVGVAVECWYTLYVGLEDGRIVVTDVDVDDMVMLVQKPRRPLTGEPDYTGDGEMMSAVFTAGRKRENTTRNWLDDDIWEAHYLGGKRQLCEAEIRIPEFDPEKLA